MEVHSKNIEIPYCSDIRRIGRIPWFEQYASQKLGLSLKEVSARTFDQLLKLLIAKGSLNPDPPPIHPTVSPIAPPLITPVLPTPAPAPPTQQIIDQPSMKGSETINYSSNSVSRGDIPVSLREGKPPPGYMSQISERNRKILSHPHNIPSFSISKQTEAKLLEPVTLTEPLSKPFADTHGDMDTKREKRGLLSLAVANSLPPTQFREHKTQYVRNNLIAEKEKQKEKLIQQSQQLLQEIKEIHTVPPLSQIDVEKERGETSDYLKKCLQEWYETTIATRQQWMTATADKYLRQLECQKRIEEELKRSSVHANDETDLMAFTFDINRKRIELESLFNHIENTIEVLSLEISQRREKEEEWTNQNLLSQELTSYLMEKRQILHNFVCQLGKLSDNMRPFFHSKRELGYSVGTRER